MKKELISLLSAAVMAGLATGANATNIKMSLVDDMYYGYFGSQSTSISNTYGHTDSLNVDYVNTVAGDFITMPYLKFDLSALSELGQLQENERIKATLSLYNYENSNNTSKVDAYLVDDNNWDESGIYTMSTRPTYSTYLNTSVYDGDKTNWDLTYAIRNAYSDFLNDSEDKYFSIALEQYIESLNGSPAFSKFYSKEYGGNFIPELIVSTYIYIPGPGGSGGEDPYTPPPPHTPYSPSLNFAQEQNANNNSLPVPEPTSMLLGFLGISGALGIRRKN